MKYVVSVVLTLALSVPVGRGSWGVSGYCQEPAVVGINPYSYGGIPYMGYPAPTVTEVRSTVPVGPMPRKVVVEETRSMGAVPKYEWKRLPAADDASVKPVFLLRDGIVVGTYQHDKYKPFDAAARRYGEPCNPPVPLDTATLQILDRFDTVTANVVDGKTVANFGVNLDAGKPAGADTPPNDLDKWRVTARSDDKAVIDAVKNAIAPWKDKVLFQAYPPGHWALSPGLDFGVVHVEKPPREDGKAELVSTIRDTDNLGPRVATALRKADPSFNAAVVPDTSKQTGLDDVLNWLKSPSPVGGLPWWVVVAGVAVVYFQMKKSQKVG